MIIIWIVYLVCVCVCIFLIFNTALKFSLPLNKYSLTLFIICCQTWNETSEPCTYSVSNVCMYLALFTTLPHKRAGMFVQRSRLCFIAPRWHVCRGVCLLACVLFVCAWYCRGGGWGFGGTGEINQNLAGKQPSCCPPLQHHPHPQPSCLWSIYCAMMHRQLWEAAS